MTSSSFLSSGLKAAAIEVFIPFVYLQALSLTMVWLLGNRLTPMAGRAGEDPGYPRAYGDEVVVIVVYPL